MKKVGIIGALLLIAFVTFISLGCTRSETEQRLRFATGGTGGTYYPLGTAIGQVIQENTGITIIVEATGASRANIQLIDADEVELAIVQNDVMDYAWQGVDLFQGERSQSFNAIAGLYPEQVQVIAAAGSGINSIADLRGKSVSVGDAGSGVEFNSRQVLGAYGISFSDINVQNLGFSPSADALRDGRIDAFFCVAGAPTSAIIDLATGRDIVILPIDGTNAAQLMRDYPFYTEYLIPAGTYRGQTSAVRTLTIKATLIAASSVSEETIYQFTKSMFENHAQLAAAHSRGADINLTDAVQVMGSVPFHPGAARYFREVGALR